MAQIIRTGARLPLAEGRVTVRTRPSANEIVLCLSARADERGLNIVLKDFEFLEIMRSVFNSVNDERDAYWYKDWVLHDLINLRDLIKMEEI